MKSNITHSEEAGKEKKESTEKSLENSEQVAHIKTSVTDVSKQLSKLSTRTED